jgi:hypothetical protein
VADGEGSGGCGGCVVVDVVAPGVSEVEEGLYGVLGGSARWYARSTTPGVVSCGG